MGWLRKVFNSGKQKALNAIPGNWVTLFDWWPGAWQQSADNINREAVSAYWAVFACVTLIAGDIAKLPAKVMQRLPGGIWAETMLRPVLRKPNPYQTRVEFFQSLVYSLLLHGNAYILKARNESGHVVGLFVLDPCRVTPLVADDGSIFYQLGDDQLSRLPTSAVVPERELIHIRINALHHPLCGLSPIYACGVSAMQGIAIQKNSRKFFENLSRPGGTLTAPGTITPAQAEDAQTRWQANYSGNNTGKIAVLGNGLKYEPIAAVNAVDAQLIEQLKMTAEMVASCFHVPGHKIGVGQMPTVNNTAVLNQQYYDQALQVIIEAIELRLDEGLELSEPYETWFDLSGLLRMDPEARFKSHSEAIKGGWMAPNEARKQEDLAPVAGGDSPLMQVQNYSLEALAKRDQQDDPFASPGSAPANDPQPDDPPNGEEKALRRQLNTMLAIDALRRTANVRV